MAFMDEVISKIADWDGKDISITSLSGGLTNSNFKVVVDGMPYFVRVPGASTDLLAINRDNEYHNSKAAFVAGVGPKVLYHLPEYNVMVLMQILNMMALESKHNFQAPQYNKVVDRLLDNKNCWAAKVAKME